MNVWSTISRCGSTIGRYLMGLIVALAIAGTARAQETRVLTLTLEETVERALRNSYGVRQLQMNVEQTRSWLRAERASLRSRVYMNLSAPEFDAISNNQWNSDLQKYELVRENNRLWQMDFTIQQPVILFGYPTNGYLSLNNRMYRYTQLGGTKDVTYYNRYFIRYQQPLFQPNSLKIDIEEAELNLADTELQFREDIVRMMDDVADDYYELFEIAYQEQIFEDQIDLHRRAATIAQRLAETDTTRLLELSQIQVELANRSEQLRQAHGSYRLEASEMAQRLRLAPGDSIAVVPATVIEPLAVDVEEAIQYGLSLRPQLRRLDIRRRRDELDVDQAKGWDSFRVNFEATYGRETQDPRFQALWDRPSNSYTVGLHAYVPIWDWGRRREQIQAERIGLQKTELLIEEAQNQIRSDISNAVQNLREYQERTLSMQSNREQARQIAESTMALYGEGRVGVIDLLQSFRRLEDTEQNFVRAFLGFREAIRSLQNYTHYDFEHDVPVFERFRLIPNGDS
ncbi:MAG TPA: TolC family protein [Rhodothermales bacterium]